MSSTEPAEEPPMGERKAEIVDVSTSMSTLTRKSYRRKYRKIMVVFEEKMRESNSLFKEKQRIMDISLRLAEQTDQLLELLLELNSCPQVPPRLRYDLNSPGRTAPPNEEAKAALTEEDANLELHKARSQLQAGELTLAEYREIEATILRSSELAPTHSYSSLLLLVPCSNQPTDRTDSSNTASGGLLSIRQEEQYLQSLDLFLNGTAPNPRSHAMNSLGSRNAEKNAERERETQLRNPMSVYNWLRKHQPQVFLQDNEASTDKTPRATGSRSSARKSAQQKELIKQEKDYDDDGFAADSGPSSRGKRKRDDDRGYRPKGGSSRSAKRRKETKDDPAKSKRTKKLSIDAR